MTVQWWNARGVQLVLDATQDAVVVVDADGHIVHANRAAGRLVGITDGELIGRVAAEVLVPTDGSRVLARALRGSLVRGALTTLRRLDGSGVPVQVEGGHAGDDIVLVMQDESERVETQTALADARQRLADLESLGRVGLWQWQPRTDEVQWSNQLYRIHDLDPVDFGGRLRDHLAPVREDLRDEVREALQSAAAAGGAFEFEYVVVRRDGGERWIYSRADAVQDSQNRVLALTGIAQDVTEDRRARAEIEEARARLDRFARVLAHDLRAPLSTVAGFAEMIETGEATGEEADVMLGRIHANTRRAIELLDGVLAEARRSTDEPSGEVDLEAVAAWVTEVLQDQIQRTASQVTSRGLPRVLGHEPLLRQALLNLVGNAIKYRRPGRGARVEISAVAVGDMVELRVDDDGPGIPAGLRDEVFDDGVRVERDVRRGIEGSGIGLATVRTIARRHGTTVAVGDSPLGGARFTLQLSPAHAG